MLGNLSRSGLMARWVCGAAALAVMAGTAHGGTKREDTSGNRPAPAAKASQTKVNTGALPSNIRQPFGTSGGVTNSAADLKDLERRYAAVNATAPKPAPEPKAARTPEPRETSDRRDHERERDRDRDRGDRGSLGYAYIPPWNAPAAYSPRAPAPRQISRGVGYDRRDCDTPVVVHGTHGAGVYYDSYRRPYRYMRSSCGTYYERVYVYDARPTTRYTLVDVSPDFEAARSRPDDPGAYHEWQRSVRDAAAGQTVYVPGPAPVSPSPTNQLKGNGELSPGQARVLPDPGQSGGAGVMDLSSAWEAVRAGRFLEAQSLLSERAGSAGDQALVSAGYAVVASMLAREEAAAWALRRALDLDPRVGERLPRDPVFRARVLEAAQRMTELSAAQPNADRVFLARELGALSGEPAR